MRKTILLFIFIVPVSLIMVSACKKEVSNNKGSFTIERYVPDKNQKPLVLVPGGFKELKFIPPTGGEEITVEEDDQYKTMENRIMIYKTKQNKKDLLYMINPETNFFYIEKNMGNIYFTIEDGDLNNGLNDLWEIIVKEGIIKNTNIKIGDIFKFSPDGKFLCYVYNDYGKYFDLYSPANWAYIPVIKMLNLNSGEEVTYDFSKTFLKDEWGALVDIEPKTDRFDIEFSNDIGLLGKGYILLSNKKFYLTEK